MDCFSRIMLFRFLEEIRKDIIPLLFFPRIVQWSRVITFHSLIYSPYTNMIAKIQKKGEIVQQQSTISTTRGENTRQEVKKSFVTSWDILVIHIVTFNLKFGLSNLHDYKIIKWTFLLRQSDFRILPVVLVTKPSGHDIHSGTVKPLAILYVSRGQGWQDFELTL